MKDEVPSVKTPIPVQLDTRSKVSVPPPNVTTALSEPTKWNTKNLGLRLGTDFAGAASAALSVAPLITIIDRGIMENASGRNNIKDSVLLSLKDLVVRPQTLLFSKPFALICMLYGGTYLSANILDTVTSTVQDKPATLVTSGPTKFAVSSTSNISLCLIKDRAFVRLYGPGGPPRPVPLPSLALFAIRDCMTIFASFNIPPLLGPVLSKQIGEDLDKRISGQTIAQFVAPATIQIFSTPLHLLGLDLYNRNGKDITWSERYQIVKKNWPISTVARVCRIVPAYGIGGIVNAKVRRRSMEKLL